MPSDFYCPRCMLLGAVHSECDATGVIAQKVGRFSPERYTVVQLVCCRCGYLFWSSHPKAVALAASNGFTFAATS